MTGDLSRRLQSVVERTAEGVDGVVVRVEQPARGFSWSTSCGEIGEATPFFVASTTKLYTAAIVRRLIERSVLSIDDRLVDRVAPGEVDGLHIHRGVDHTASITLRHLLAHTSGLPDYFAGRKQQRGEQSLDKQLRSNHDVAWNVQDAVRWAREDGARFVPGHARRAFYSDTNYQLLGRVIEYATSTSYNEALEHEVIRPLGLTDTWLYTDPADQRPLALRHRRQQLDIPNAMVSFGPDGGIVATSADLMRFLVAFHTGELFDPTVDALGGEYRRALFPLQAGVGHMRFRLPRAMWLRGTPPDLRGHSGLSGAFAFVDVDSGIYLAGTVNEIAQPSRSFKLMLKLVREVSASTP
jgi:CubicO group peptidase (beta-lactamase class C family)